MEITEVKVFPVEEEKLKAFVSIVFDHCFMVNDIKVIRGKDGLFISMPSRRKKNGRFKDVAHPLNNETRQGLEKVILREYERALSGEGPVERRANAARKAPEAPAEPAPVAEAVTEPAAAEVPNEPAAAPEGEKKEADEQVEDRSLEEIAELHLRDSFWST